MGDKSGLTYDQVVGIICGVIFGTAFIVFIILACVGFFRNWKCIAGDLSWYHHRRNT